MKTTMDTRVLQELLETAEDLKKYGLVTEADLARLKALRDGQAKAQSTSDRQEKKPRRALVSVEH